MSDDETTAEPGLEEADTGSEAEDLEPVDEEELTPEEGRADQAGHDLPGIGEFLDDKPALDEDDELEGDD